MKKTNTLKKFQENQIVFILYFESILLSGNNTARQMPLKRSSVCVRFFLAHNLLQLYIKLQIITAFVQHSTARRNAPHSVKKKKSFNICISFFFSCSVFEHEYKYTNWLIFQKNINSFVIDPFFVYIWQYACYQSVSVRWVFFSADININFLLNLVLCVPRSNNKNVL